MTISRALRHYASSTRASVSQRFFKTGPGQYGEGDVFVGVTVPDTRKVARQYDNLSFEKLHKLLQSEIHEERLLALLILVEQFKKGDQKKQREIFTFYTTHLDRVNNWDLVDLSAHQIIGAWLQSRSHSLLYRLAKSKNMWHRRVAIVATYHFIRVHDFRDTISIAKVLFRDDHDLIHKAVGWMLREVGKRDERVLCDFLDIHTPQMPRTMLRYAIERLPVTQRRNYMKRS
jgi:3-methyladenine DNA glycosylase AlkD